MFDHNQISRDGQGIMAEAMSSARRSPLSDRRLLEFMLTVPEPMFQRNGVSRSFARRVLADRLPREAARRAPDQGVAAPAWFPRAECPAQRYEARSGRRIEASPLARRACSTSRASSA